MELKYPAMLLTAEIPSEDADGRKALPRSDNSFLLDCYPTYPLNYVVSDATAFDVTRAVNLDDIFCIKQVHSPSCLL